MKILVALCTSLTLCFFLNIIIFYVINDTSDDDNIIYEKLGLHFLIFVINTPLCYFLPVYQRFARSQFNSLFSVLYDSLQKLIDICLKIINYKPQNQLLEKLLFILYIIIFIYCTALSICITISIFSYKFYTNTRIFITLDLSVTFFCFSLLICMICFSHKINILLLLLVLCFIPIFKRYKIASSIFAAINICLFLVFHIVFIASSIKNKNIGPLSISFSLSIIGIPIIRSELGDFLDIVFGGASYVPLPNLPRTIEYNDYSDDLKTTLAEIRQQSSLIKGTATRLPNGEPGIINREKGVIEDIYGNVKDIIYNEDEFGIYGRSGYGYNTSNHN